MLLQWVKAVSVLQACADSLVSGLATGMIAEAGEQERELDPWELDSDDD